MSRYFYADGSEKVVGIYDPARPTGEEFYWTNEPEVKWQGEFILKPIY